MGEDTVLAVGHSGPLGQDRAGRFLEPLRELSGDPWGTPGPPHRELPRGVSTSWDGARRGPEQPLGGAELGRPFPADLPGACKPPVSRSVAEAECRRPSGRARVRPALGPRWAPPLTVRRVSLFQVTMPGEPVDVACGVDHMVTLARSFI